MGKGKLRYGKSKEGNRDMKTVNMDQYADPDVLREFSPRMLRARLGLGKIGKGVGNSGDAGATARAIISQGVGQIRT